MSHAGYAADHFVQGWSDWRTRQASFDIFQEASSISASLLRVALRQPPVRTSVLSFRTCSSQKGLAIQQDFWQLYLDCIFVTCTALINPRNRRITRLTACLRVSTRQASTLSLSGFASGRERVTSGPFGNCKDPIPGRACCYIQTYAGVAILWYSSVSLWRVKWVDSVDYTIC